MGSNIGLLYKYQLLIIINKISNYYTNIKFKYRITILFSSQYINIVCRCCIAIEEEQLLMKVWTGDRCMLGK